MAVSVHVTLPPGVTTVGVAVLTTAMSATGGGSCTTTSFVIAQVTAWPAVGVNVDVPTARGAAGARQRAGDEPCDVRLRDRVGGAGDEAVPADRGAALVADLVAVSPAGTGEIVKSNDHVAA